MHGKRACVCSRNKQSRAKFILHDKNYVCKERENCFFFSLAKVTLASAAATTAAATTATAAAAAAPDYFKLSLSIEQLRRRI